MKSSALARSWGFLSKKARLSKGLHATGSALVKHLIPPDGAAIDNESKGLRWLGLDANSPALNAGTTRKPAELIEEIFPGN